MTYKKEINLDHNEIAAKVNNETGELTLFTNRPNNIPENKTIQKFEEFNKVNSKAIRFLETVLTNEELGIVFKMINRADYETNVMLPLNDDSSYREISNEFGINKDKVSKIFKKLFDLGVYAQVKVANGINSEYWTLSPYVAWKGKFIEKSISIYFYNTIIGKSVI